ATFGATTLTSAGSTDGFVARLSATGAWLSAVRVGGPGPEQLNDLEVRADGTAYLAGSFAQTAAFGPLSLTTATGTGTTDTDVFDVAVDNSGTISLGGAFVGTIDFGDSLALPTLTSRGATDLLLARLSPAGTWLWATSAGGANVNFGAFFGDKALAVAVDPAG